MEKGYIVTRNILFNFGGQFLLLLISFITTPIIIAYLGIDYFGVLSILAVVIGYFSLLDLGMGVSIIKYISEYSAKEDKEGIEKIIGTALTVYTTLGLLGGLLIFFLSKYIVTNFLMLPSALIFTTLSVFYISALGFFVNMVLTVFNSIPSALERMDITNTRNVAVGILNAAGTITLLSLGYGIIGIVILNILVSITVTIILFFDIKKILPGLSFRFIFDKEVFIKLLKFSGYKFIGNTGGQIVFQLDKLLLGFFHPISYVTFYTVPSTLIQRAFSLMLNITNGVFPSLSNSFGSANRERSLDLYLRMGKFITFIMAPLMIFLFIFADVILFLWLDENFASQSSMTLRILTAAYFVASLSAPGVIACDASGNPRLPALFAGISAIINIIAALILIPKLGIQGAAFALLINFIAQVPLFMIIVNKKLMKVSNIEFISKAVIKPLFSGFAAAVLCLFLRYFSALNPLMLLLSGTVVFSISYLIINILTGTFDEKDKKTVIFFLNKFKEIKYG